jgi:hypothetical protein
MGGSWFRREDLDPSTRPFELLLSFLWVAWRDKEDVIRGPP